MKLSERIKASEVYRVKHSKTGNTYNICDIAEHTETGELMVTYARDEDAPTHLKLWVRPLAMFDDSVEVNGEMVPRFVSDHS